MTRRQLGSRDEVILTHLQPYKNQRSDYRTNSDKFRYLVKFPELHDKCSAPAQNLRD